MKTFVASSHTSVHVAVGAGHAGFERDPPRSSSVPMWLHVDVAVPADEQVLEEEGPVASIGVGERVDLADVEVVVAEVAPWRRCRR